MNAFQRLAFLPVVPLLVSAAPAEHVISMPDAPNFALVIPARTPVKFRAWKDGYAHFDGRFVLTGDFTLSLMEGCDLIDEACLAVDIEPDPAIAARLPRWKNDGDMWITIIGERQMIRSIANPTQRAALLANKIPRLTGRTSIIVNGFSAGVECDSTYYLARFVAFTKPPQLARTKFTGGYGCGA